MTLAQETKGKKLLSQRHCYIRWFRAEKLARDTAQRTETESCSRLLSLSWVCQMFCVLFVCVCSVHCRRKRRQIQFLNLDKPATMKNVKLVTISFGVCGNFSLSFFCCYCCCSFTHFLVGISQKNMRFIISFCLLWRDGGISNMKLYEQRVDINKGRVR